MVARHPFKGELNDGLPCDREDNAAEPGNDSDQHACGQDAALRVKSPLAEFEELGEPTKGMRRSEALGIV